MSPELPRDTTLDLWMEYLETKGDYGYRTTDEENDLLLKVERVINLWCERGKPFAPPALGTYYASGTWNMPRLYNDIDALQKIKTPNSTPGECGQFY